MSEKEKARLAGRAPEQLNGNSSSAPIIDDDASGCHQQSDCLIDEDAAADMAEFEMSLVRQESAELARPGAEILDEVLTFLKRFIAYPDEESAIAHALWIAHSHRVDLWESTPRLAFLSPEPGSGKTRALELTELLVPNPAEAVSMTASALFRLTQGEEGLPTILHDEVDTVFGPRAKGNEELRALLNAGHRRGATVCRSVGDRHGRFTVERIEAFCAVALAGLGDLPDTILSRSIVISMRRRSRDEHVEAFRRRLHAQEGHALRDKLAAWLVDEPRFGQPEFVWPEMPAGVDDRDADIWESLLAIAEAAGGNWPQRARVTAVTVVTRSRESSPSLGIRLLSDLQQVFGGGKAMPSTEIIKRLNALEEAPWAELDGAGLDPRRLASLLSPYGVRPATIRIEGRPQKGYRASDLRDAWERYVPRGGSPDPVTKVTSVAGLTGSRN